MRTIHNVITSKVICWNCRSISSVCLAIDVNNSVIHILFLVDFSIISRVTIGKFVRVKILSLHETVSHWLGSIISWNSDMRSIHNVVSSKVIGWNCRPISSVGVTVNVNNIVVHVFLFMNFSIVSRVSISKFIRVLVEQDSTISHWLSSIVSWNSDVRSCNNMISSEVVAWDFGGISSVSLTWKSTDVAIDIIMDVQKVLFMHMGIVLAHQIINLDVHFIIMMVVLVVFVLMKASSVNSFLSFIMVLFVVVFHLFFVMFFTLSLGLKPLVREAVIINDIIILIVFIFELLVFALITVSNLVAWLFVQSAR